MRRTFTDQNLQKEFEQNGYVIVDALSSNEIQKIKNDYQSLKDPLRTDFESTMNNPSAKHKKQVYQTIQPVTQTIAKSWLDNYKDVTANYVIKLPTQNSKVPAHQDWNMCDETKYSGVNIWIALDDVNEINGAIYILKHGNSVPQTIRGNFIPSSFTSELFEDHKKLTPIFLKAGQALIYDLRCIHTSPSNRSGKPRFAIGCAYIPTEATPVHYFYDEAKGQLNCYETTNEFYFNYAYGVNKVPDNVKIIEQKSNPSFHKIDSSILLSILNKQEKYPRKIFKDQFLQNLYEENGYVIIDFLSAPEVKHLFAEFEKLSSWFSSGFMSSVYAQQPGYKEKVNDLLEPFGKKIIEETMIDYEMIIGTIMAKGISGNTEMYPHQDWTLVDENKHASFNIWIPLVDVNEKNGALSIMKGGHKMPFTMRGSNVPDALKDKSQFTPDRLTFIPMKAGQALIYDHRCIHVSPPNTSGKIRPACAIGAIPKNAEVFHYFYHQSTHQLRRYKANKEFYFNHVATQNNEPLRAELIDEINAPEFYTFTQEDLSEVFAKQELRKTGFWERLFKDLYN